MWCPFHTHGVLFFTNGKCLSSVCPPPIAVHSSLFRAGAVSYAAQFLAHNYTQLSCSVQRWPKKCVLSCVITPLAAGAISRNLGHTFWPSVYMMVHFGPSLTLPQDPSHKRKHPSSRPSDRSLTTKRCRRSRLTCQTLASPRSLTVQSSPV